ncbi:methyltransferase [Vibrio metoecus]|uniref:methyltransferase n=1 Tax=Vibrio metoecus TaxID=1481663 RepID=UPI0006D7E20E|nr:methyltransferase [Vibrio metoecus]KQB02772.1 SAM-dependent methyltransferase [Vibrio metoecus]PAR57590.1 methyltransferase [Vibrio metoecus]PAR69650.1 methyltransferase [Vibrio metoecus]
MQAQFKLLDSFLTQTQPFWRYEAFHACRLAGVPWGEQKPTLTAWLHSLTQREIEQYKAEPEHLFSVLSEFFPPLDEVRNTLVIQPCSLPGLLLPKFFDKGIPGRKWQQIEAMSKVLIAHHQGNQWLEWCAGKGYLGRILACVSQQPVVSFEYQAELCCSGQQEADLLQLPMQFVQGDALDERSASLFEPSTHAVALHACGDLHVKMLQYATSAHADAISFSPCCYHLTQTEQYQGMSSLAQRSALTLTRQELRLPLQETVTGGDRVKRHRQQEMVYRFGFDALMTQVCNLSSYTPVPSIQKSKLNQGFAEFCQWAVQEKNLAVDFTEVDFAYFESIGYQRFWQMERISLVQDGFRRLLELWLVLDKALYLQENGYEVSLSEFCDRKVTPRNLVVNAQRRKGESR